MTQTNKAALIATLIAIAVALPLLGFSYWMGYQDGKHAAPPTRIVETSPPIAGLSRETILKMLPGKTWYRHWETKDRSRPTMLNVNSDGHIQGGGGADKWKLELRWVLDEGDHLYIPIDEYTIRGFFISTGRQKGMFADKPK